MRWIDLRDELLADAALAEQQDGGVRRRRALDRVPHVPQRGTLADHLVPHFDRPLQRPVLVAQPCLVERVADRDEDALAGERLLDEVECASLRRLDGGADGAVAGDDHDGQRLVGAPHALQRLEAVHAGHLDVEKDQVGRVAFGERHAFRSARGLDDLVALVLEDHPQRPADLRLVIDNQNP